MYKHGPELKQKAREFFKEADREGIRTLLDLMTEVYFDGRYHDDLELLDPKNMPAETPQSVTGFGWTMQEFWEALPSADRRYFLYNFDKTIRADVTKVLISEMKGPRMLKWSLIHPKRHDHYHRVHSNGQSALYHTSPDRIEVFSSEGVSVSPEGTFEPGDIRLRVMTLLSEQYNPFKSTWYVS